MGKLKWRALLWDARITCVNETGSEGGGCGQNPGFIRNTSALYNQIEVSKKGLNDGCGCLEGTLAHEVLHNWMIFPYGWEFKHDARFGGSRRLNAFSWVNECIKCPNGKQAF